MTPTAVGAPLDPVSEAPAEAVLSAGEKTGAVVPWQELSGKPADPETDGLDAALPVVPLESGSNVELMCEQDAVVMEDDQPVAKQADTLDGPGVGSMQAMTASICDDPRVCRDQRCDTNKIVCSDDSIHHVPMFVIQAWTTYPIEVRTSNLRSLWGETDGRPDTVIYLLRCDDGSCTSGNIVAIDDDGNTETTCRSDSKLVVTPPLQGTYAVVVAGKCSGAGGVTDIRIDVNASTTTYLDQVFGGMTVRSVESRAGDSVFVGKSPNSSVAGYLLDREYHDSLLWVLSNSATTCTSACGQFLFNDDLVPSNLPDSQMLLSKVDIPTGFPATNNAVLVGSYRGQSAASPYTFNGRLMRYRRHTTEGGAWTRSAQRDHDGDGLSQELEAILGSCDDATDATTNIGVAGLPCVAFAALVNGYRNAKTARTCDVGSADPYCWSATDSDNDGIPDYWEVFGGVVRCTHAPQPPYQAVGACPRLGLHEDPSGCANNGACFALAVSALSDPDPGAYDVYVNNDYWACVGPWCHLLHNQTLLDETHRMTNLQQQVWLPQVWTGDPSTCWDGSQPPCTDPADRPYRARIHVYDGSGLDVPDCNTGSAVPMGPRAARTFWNYEFDPRRKYTGFFRFALAGDASLGGGATDEGAPVLGWANLQTAFSTVQSISHEVGHTLGLTHPFENEDGFDKDCAGPDLCPRVADNCKSASCAPYFNPQVASLMNYAQVGSLPKSASLPTTSCREGCDYENGRFSKGLDLVLDESALVEGHDELEWRTIKRVQGLHCMVDSLAPDTTGPAVCAEFCDRTLPVTCGSGTCQFDWNRNGTFEELSYPWDLTYGRLDADPQTTCDEDVLEDTNEWLSIFALGKDVLDVVRVEDGQDNRHFPNFPLYKDSFNGAAPQNLLAAPLSVASSVTMDEDNYPRNVANLGASCPSGSIKRDACTENAECLPFTCVNGRCGCEDDEDCRSFACGADDRCDTALGVCTCGPMAPCPPACVTEGGGCNCPCPGGGTCTNGVCSSSRQGRDDPPNSDYRPPFDSAKFDGSGSGTYARLTSTGQSSVTETITMNDGFGVLVELRFDGFAPGQTRQTVISSGSFEIAIVSSGGLAKLEVTSGSQPPLVFPGRDVGRPLAVDRWYRVRVGLWDGELFATVTAWNTLTGWYDDAHLSSGCVWTTWPTDIWLGHDGFSDSVRFDGALDNLTISNVRVNGTLKATACELQ